MKKLVIAVAVFCFTKMVTAQLSESDTARWQFSSSVTGMLAKGNLERFILTTDANVSHVSRNKLFGFSSGNRYSFGTFGKYRTENNVMSRNFIYLLPEKRFYPYIMLWLTRHEQQQLNFRYQVGAGGTAVALRKKEQLIKVSLTITYEDNYFRQSNLTYLGDTAQKKYDTWRATVRLFGRHRFAKNIVELYYEAWFQQSLTNIRNWRVFVEGGLNVKVYKGLSVKSFVNYEYQTVHIQKLKPGDILFNFGVNYKWVSKN